MRIGLGVFLVGTALILATPANAVTVDYNSSRGITSTTVYGFQHLVTGLGYGGGDRNGVGSTQSVPVGNGVADGLEFSLFEYVLANDFSGLPDGALKTRLQGLHADAVAAFQQNEAALLDIVDGANDDGETCDPGNIGRLPFMEFLFADTFGGVGAPFEFPVCTPRNGMFLGILVHLTVDADLGYPSSLMGVLLGGLAGPPYDFTNDSNFDKSVSVYFDATGDIDGDGISNLDEVAAVDADIAAAGMDLSALDGRAQSDLRFGWIIDKAVLNASAYSPLFSTYGGTDPGGDGGEIGGTISVSSSWVEVGDRVEFGASLAGATGFQWHKDDGPLGGETASTLIIDPVDFSDAGDYFCAITTPAKVTVNTPTVTLQVFGVGTLPVAGFVGVGFLVAVAALAGARRLGRK